MSVGVPIIHGLGCTTSIGMKGRTDTYFCPYWLVLAMTRCEKIFEISEPELGHWPETEYAGDRSV